MKRYGENEMIHEQHPVRDASIGRKKKNRLLSTDRCNPNGLQNALYPASAHAQRYENVTHNKALDRTEGLDFYDYEARQYDPLLMRFTVPDPLQEKYYAFSQYAYCMNNPVRFVDPDGKTPRIYVEKKGVGHTFVTTGEGKNTTVYTYGRYGDTDKNKSSSGSLSSSGEGVLIVMKGVEALNYIKHEYKNKGASIYEVTNGSDEKIDAHFSDMYNSSDKKPSGEGKYANADNARVVDTYDLMDNNCTTKTSDAVKIGTDGKLDLKSRTPANIDTKLYYFYFNRLKKVKQKFLNICLLGN